MLKLLKTHHVLRTALLSPRPQHTKRLISSKAQGPGIGSIAFGIGLGTTAAALTGTALYAAFNPSFKEYLVNKVLSPENFITRAEKQKINSKRKLLSVTEEPKLKLEKTSNEQLKEESVQESSVMKENVGAKKYEGKNAETQIEAITKSLLELQSALNMSCLAAVSAYSLAAQSVRGLTEELDQHAKELQDDRGHQSAENDIVVLELLEKNRDGKKMVHLAEKAAILARSHIEILKKALSDLCCAEIPLTNDLIDQLEVGLAESEMQLGEAEEFLKQALTRTEPPEILQKRVAIVTSDLEEELGFSLLGSGSSEQREVFLRALAWQLLHYRNNVEHTLTSHELHTKELLSAKGEQGTEIRLQALVEAKETELKHILSEENFLNLNQLKKKFDHEIREELRVQQWHATEAKQMTLRDKRASFDRELAEQWNEINYVISENRQNLIEELTKILPNLNDIQRAITQSSDALILSTMSHSMVDVLQTDPFPQLDWSHQIQPIDHLVATMQDISCDDADEFVDGVIKTIPNKALNRGVYTLNALKKRFYEVEKLARKVSLLKERDTNSLLLYLLSYLRSVLLIRPVSSVSLSEKQDKPKHQGRLNNEDILDRAKFFMEQGDFRQAISYMNLLQGVAQFVSSGWSEEMLVHLEVMQAAQTLAAFSSLLVHHNIEHN